MIQRNCKIYFSELNEVYAGKVICFDGSSSTAEKQAVINNFDANAQNKEDEFRILITTEVLAEGEFASFQCGNKL